jgi:hypothetical protein
MGMAQLTGSTAPSAVHWSSDAPSLHRRTIAASPSVVHLHFNAVSLSLPSPYAQECHQGHHRPPHRLPSPGRRHAPVRSTSPVVAVFWCATILRTLPGRCTLPLRCPRQRPSPVLAAFGSPSAAVISHP